ncbi:transglycosylase SLT domain-containing protein [[Haemophilus] felis]|nr:transglycosylase SLT domain-containing protein [[Haemophilus] felis]
MSSLSVKMLFSLFAQCASDVAPETLHTLIGVESSRNPYAIAVVYDKNTPDEKKLHFNQPQTEQEAQNIISALNAEPITYKSYSVGLMQVNSSNFKQYGITEENMFNACKNIETGAEIFKACYASAEKNNPQKNEQELLRIASSCYYSGNETRGFKTEKNGTSYVDRINATVAKNYQVPAIKPLNEENNNSSEQSPQEYEQPTPKKVRAWDIFEDF